MPSITFMKRIWRIYLQKINVVIVKIILTFSVGILDDVIFRLVDGNDRFSAGHLQLAVFAPELDPEADPGQLVRRASSIDPKVPEPGCVGNLHEEEILVVERNARGGTLSSRFWYSPFEFQLPRVMSVDRGIVHQTRVLAHEVTSHGP